MTQIACTGAILIGGRSVRMGAPKHDMKLHDGRTMLQHVADAMRPLVKRITLVGSHCQATAEYELISDLQPGLGPLSGIEALLSSGIDSQFLICPCDMPLLTTETLRPLLGSSTSRATIIHIAGRDMPESLPCRLSDAALPVVRALMKTEGRAVWRLMTALHAERVVVTEQWAPHFANVNTPEDWVRLRERFQP